jgi:dipeptidyl-peptidase-4
MYKNLFPALFLLLIVNTHLGAEELNIARLVASPALEGPTARGVKISPDGSRVTFLQGKADQQDQQDLWEYHISDGKKRLLVDSQELLGKEEVLDEVELARRERARIFASGIIEYTWSPDGLALLFPLGGNLYYLKLGSEPQQLTNTTATETDAKISPQGNYVSFIREQNLYVIDLSSGEERAITTQGGDAISYGMADFAAQEEMYRNTGYWWSKDDLSLSFTRMDESGVKLVNRYEIDAGGVTTVSQRYPFAGTPNAKLELFVQDLSSDQPRKIDLGEDPDFYIARVNYSPDGSIAVQKQTRDQKTLELIFVDPKSMEQTLVLSEQQPNWINLHSDLTFVDGGKQFIWTSERSGFNHIYLYAKNGKLVRQLTDGSWMVSPTSRTGGGVRAVDEKGAYVWFSGWQNEPTENHLFRVRLGGGEPEKMTREIGWHDAWVATDGSFYVVNGQGPMRPPYTAIRSASGELLTYITENALDESHPYHPYLTDHRSYEFGKLTTTNGTELQYQIALPGDFDPAQKYPAVVYLYGGPGAGQSVQKVWPIDGRLEGMKQILARHGYVVFTIDNRGTPNRGKAFEDVLYRNMGDFEVRDQLLGLNWLKSQEFVDENRVGIFGWSYGGYMTLMNLLKHPGAYKAGISGAPVTNWRLYDTHYTERYMGHPDDGDGKYEISSPISYAENLSDPLLIVHGMADDNVFFDNTVQMINALQELAKPFEMMTYPGKRHRIVGEAENTHVWNMFLEFFNRHLKEQ